MGCSFWLSACILTRKSANRTFEFSLLPEQIDRALAGDTSRLPQEVLTLALEPHEFDAGLQASGRGQQQRAPAFADTRILQAIRSRTPS